MWMGNTTRSNPTTEPAAMSDQTPTALPAAKATATATNVIAGMLCRAADQARANHEAQRAELLALGAQIARLTSVAYTSEREADWTVAVRLIEGHLQEAATTLRASALREASNAINALR